MKTLKPFFLIAIKKTLLVLGMAGLAGAALLFFSDSEVTIQSLESKTETGGAVFNRILWIRENKRDIWMMNQSHQGLSAPSQSWDRLAIVIDKTVSPKRATFLQLPAGPLKWDDSLFQQKQNFRVSCFMCHSNGPRALRADDSQALMSFGEKLKVLAWNLRIKTYGRIVESELHQKTDPKLATPFRHRTERDNQPLKVKTCTKCHHEGGFWARGRLTRQNLITIQFLVQNRLMPPPGFSLSKKEQGELQEFISGF